MDERVKFIARFLEGEKVARLALEFRISRKTAYKIIDRYQDTGLVALSSEAQPKKTISLCLHKESSALPCRKSV